MKYSFGQHGLSCWLFQCLGGLLNSEYNTAFVGLGRICNNRKSHQFKFWHTKKPFWSLSFKSPIKELKSCPKFKLTRGSTYRYQDFISSAYRSKVNFGSKRSRGHNRVKNRGRGKNQENNIWLPLSVVIGWNCALLGSRRLFCFLLVVVVALLAAVAVLDLGVNKRRPQALKCWLFLFDMACTPNSQSCLHCVTPGMSKRNRGGW